MFLMETLVDSTKVEIIREMLLYEGSYVINNEGHSGGLIMLWKEQRSGKVNGSLRNHFDTDVTMTGNAP